MPPSKVCRCEHTPRKEIIPDEQRGCEILFREKHLSVLSTGSTIEEIDNLENVVANPEYSSDEEFLEEATVACVQQLEMMYCCINCKKAPQPQVTH